MTAWSLEEARRVVPRPAATVLILRDGARGPEVLMVRRSPNAKFMPNAYVFPGGAVDRDDAAVASDESEEALRARLSRAFTLGGQERAFAIAALRESLEECGLWLGVDAPGVDLVALRRSLFDGETIRGIADRAGLPLVTSGLAPWSRWVTPFGRLRRFDTVFFVSRAPAGQVPEVDAQETTTLEWVEPAAALRACEAGSFQMEFATRAIVRSLLPFAGGNVQACVDHGHGLTEIGVVCPRLRLDEQGNTLGILMPGESGYEELPEG